MKIWLVMMESCVDGEMFFDSIPFNSLKNARKFLRQEKKWVLEESVYYQGYTEEEVKEEFEVEENLNRFYINNPCDSYYEEYRIVKREVYE